MLCDRTVVSVVSSSALLHSLKEAGRAHVGWASEGLACIANLPHIDTALAYVSYG
jgi:hypothetical protein